MDNSSNIIREIVMTPEMSYMMCYTQEKNELKNVISQQSNEIARLLGEVQLWKEKYEGFYNNII